MGVAPWRRLALVIYLPSAVSFIGFGAITPLVPLTARNLGSSVAEAALVVALMGIGALVGALPAGVIAARFGEKKSLVGALFLDVACLLACAFAPTTWALAVAVFVVGLSGSMLNLARQSYLTVAVPLEYRARALSSLGGVFRIGSLVGPLMGAGVVSLWGLQAAYLVAAGTSLVAATVTTALPDLPAPNRPRSHRRGCAGYSGGTPAPTPPPGWVPPPWCSSGPRGTRCCRCGASRSAWTPRPPAWSSRSPPGST